ncbi:homeobox protein siamois-like [Aquarana catesbeiana]|uniref:homeobox protein siamois-like n=1 Tax=Aquarana catesbeiana TaxID=8400 RepID=UPI003CC98026
MDPELDHIICTVLSLEEDYPTMSPPLRNLNYPSSPNGELPNLLPIMNISGPHKVSNVLEQTLLKLYSYLGYEQEEGNSKSINPGFSEQISKITPSMNGQENLSHNQNQKVLKRKMCELETDASNNSTETIHNAGTSLWNAKSRKKTTYNSEQTAFLQNQFDLNPYPDFVTRCRIADITGIPEPRIQVWFQNRRTRHLSKDMKSQSTQGSQFSTPRHLPNIFQNPYQNLQIDGHFQIPGNMWML